MLMRKFGRIFHLPELEAHFRLKLSQIEVVADIWMPLTGHLDAPYLHE